MNVKNKMFRILFIFISLFFIRSVVYAEEIDETNNEEIEIIEEEKQDIKEEINNKIIYEKGEFKLIIEDDANLLTESEIKDLKEKMMPLLEYGNIAFKSISVNERGTTDNYADYYYHSKFNKESGSLFLIDMDKRNIYIFSDGYNYKVITKNKAYIITDNVYTYASRKDYYKCAFDAFDQMNDLLEGRKILEPMRYISNILISITVGSFIAFYIAIKMTQIKKVQDVELLKCINSHLILSNIDANAIGSHRVYSPVSDGGSSGGGSSGGGGGGGGGGGSSGGGGGHSF